MPKLLDVIHQAGFSGTSAQYMYAIAMAESDGNALAYNPNPPDNSYGLTQINMINQLGPQRRQEWGLSNNDELWDPLTNLRAAYSVSGGGQNWSPWTTYTSGAYLKYLNGPQDATISYNPENGSHALSGQPSTTLGNGSWPDPSQWPKRVTASFRKRIIKLILNWYQATFNPSKAELNKEAKQLAGMTNDQLKASYQAAFSSKDMPGPNQVEGGIQLIYNLLGNDTESAVGQAASAVNTWQTGLESIGAFFVALTWIFSVDHFMKFLLYVFGTVAIIAGLGMVTFGSGKGETPVV